VGFFVVDEGVLVVILERVLGFLLLLGWGLFLLYVSLLHYLLV
jgi:hypothetical protein